MKPCSVENCERPTVARGWCQTHYKRWKRTGSAYASPVRDLGKHVVCTVAGCVKPHLARGLCSAHWQRRNRYGNPRGGGTTVGAPASFLAQALLYKGDRCIFWPFATANGYAVMRIDGRTAGVHRHVCERTNGSPPTPEHEAAHSCGMGHFGCITPAHLGWATHTENMADTLRHGTHNRGERCGTAKLTVDDVRFVRAMRGVATQASIAAALDVSESAISLIHRRKNWAWLD